MFKAVRISWPHLLWGLCLLISIIGLFVAKDRIEYQRGATYQNELLFTLFQVLFIGNLAYAVGNWVFAKWREYQSLKNEKLRAELSNLKNQISPHFFFNTLNNLYGLIRKDQEKAQAFVLKLSDLMRYAIYSNDHETVGIKEEIEYLKNYIALHRIRQFKNVDFQFKETVDNEELKIYPLLLIILVENAFKHGVEKLVDEAFVHCKLETMQNTLKFWVVNNFDQEDAQHKGGVGLDNLKKRLALLYPGKYILDLAQDKDTFQAFLEVTIA